MIDLVETLRFLRRRSILITCILLVGVLGGVIYVETASPRYIATSMLLFDIRKIEPLQQQGYSNDSANSPFVDSQAEVLKSENVARSVIQKLDLLSDPEFAAVDFGGPADFGGQDSTNRNQLARVIRIFRNNLTVKRVGLTYIVTISYRSLEPNKAARISNAVAETYIIAELESKSEAARRADTWLQERLRELRSLAENTEEMVATYKTKKVGEDVDPVHLNEQDVGPVHLNEQQLAKLSTQRRVALSDLESSARTYRALHETLLQRVAEFTERQSFPATEARIISTALPPLEKSEPRGFLVIAVASLLGVVIGVGAAVAREYVDDGLRSPMEVEEKAGIACLGVLPMIGGERAVVRANRSLGALRAAPTTVQNATRAVNSRIESQRSWFLRRLPATVQNAVRAANSWLQSQTPSFLRRHSENGSATAGFELYRFAVDQPLSHFAETIRSLKVAAEIADPVEGQKVIGVTSVVPREGKSLVAANVSGMLAASGSKVLLIDADPRSCVGLTQQLAPNAKKGLFDTVLGNTPADTLVQRDSNADFDFLPIVRPIPAKYYASPSTMKKLLQSVQHSYDYVIVDLPPITPVADVKAVSHLIDYFIVVIEYGRSSQNAVVEALTIAPLVSKKLLGSVLNKATSTVPRTAPSFHAAPEWST